MRVICSNCNTGQDLKVNSKSKDKNPVVKCESCDKKIKIQFCPHCNAFYSITFSNIKNGNYKYKCTKCSKNFVINFEEQIEEKLSFEGNAPVADKKREERISHEPEPVEEHHLPRKEEMKKIEVSPLSSEGINSFTINEIFRAMAGSFTWEKIVAASAGAAFMLLLTRLFMFLSLQFFNAPLGKPASGTVLILFPLAILFTFYLLTASVIAKITLNNLIAEEKNNAASLIKFTCAAAPSVLLINAFLIISGAALLIIFGKIPVFGPLLFALIFLPVYLSGIVLTLFFIIGFWFYGPVAAHRGNSITANIKNLMLFIKKHNLNLIFIIPAMTLLSSVVFGILYMLHTAALYLTVRLSQAILGDSSSMLLSTAPASVIKAAEPALAGPGGSAFHGLYNSITFAHTAGGLVLGISLFILTVILFALFISITATLSTYVYIMMERGIYMDDRKKAGVMIILTATAVSALIFKKLIF